MKKIVLAALLILIFNFTGCGESKVADDTRQIAKDAIEVMEMYQDDKMDPDEADERLTELYDKANSLKLDGEQDSNNTSVIVDINNAQIKIMQDKTCIDEIKDLKEVISK